MVEGLETDIRSCPRAFAAKPSSDESSFIWNVGPGADVSQTASEARAYDVGVRGDRVEIVMDVGNGVQTYEVVASRAGRRVEVTTGRGVVEVSEITRGGKPVRTARFMSARVVALVEHPAEDEEPIARPRGRRTTRGQASLI